MEFKDLFQAQLQIEIQAIDNQTTYQKFQDIIFFKGMISKNHQQFKIQISSQNNIFFYYISVWDSKKFSSLQEFQKLNFSFRQFPKQLQQIFSQSINYKLKIQQMDGYKAILSIKKDLDYKSIDVFSIEFELAEQEKIKNTVMQRYQLMKKKKVLLENRLKQINNILKLKNPSLLIKFKKIAQFK